MISVVVFDLGGVLCQFRPDARVHALAVASGWTEAAVREQIWGSGRDTRADVGELTAEEAFALASLDGALDRSTVLRCWADAFVPNDAVLALVDRVRVRRAMLTNNGPVLEELLAHQLAAISAHCSPVMLSWRLGAVKPSRAAFDAAAERLAADPAELLLVDDSPRNVEGALAVGWDAIAFTKVEQLGEALAARGLTADGVTSE